MRRVPKYPTLKNFWIVEHWQAPEKFGSPESWDRKTREWGEEGNIPQLGPYPSRGRYGLACVLQGADGKAIPLTETVLEDVIYAVVTKGQKKPTLAELKQAQADRQKAQEAYEREEIAEGVPAFRYNDFVTVV